MGKETINSCLNCSYLLYCDAADTGYRCGHSYFSVPPKERRASRVDSYPEIALDACCEKWKGHNKPEVVTNICDK
jgi:hypothetical protein